jgi:hypothetical protein
VINIVLVKRQLAGKSLHEHFNIDAAL